MKSLKIRLILFIILIFTSFSVKSQGIDCSTASGMCAGNSGYTFPASTNVPSMGTVGCLYTTPNPAWYWMQIGNPGDLHIHMASGGDVDFICWGPFPSLAAACATNLMSNSGVDCSYSAAATEDCDILGAQTGQVYVLLITNYANITTNISFSQTSGTGTTNCAIISPPIGDTVCEGENAVLRSSHNIPGATYLWDGPGLYTTTSDSMIVMHNVTQADAGLYWLTITDIHGYVNEPVSCQLVIHSKPTITATTDSICVGETATLTAGSATSYHWNTNETTATINVMPLITTPYSVTGTSIYGCKDSAQTQVVVFNNPQVTVTPNTICSGELSTAFASNAFTYAWSNGQTTDTIRPIVTSQQIYTVTVSTDFGCRDSLTLTANPNPIITTTASDICVGESSMVVASGATNYNWSNLQSGSTISVSPMSNLNLSVIGTNQYGCIGYDTLTVIVHPKPIAGFIPSSILVTLDSSEIQFVDHSIDASTWNYNFGEFNNPLNTSTEQSPTHQYAQTGIFKVWQTVATEFGCTDSTYIRVQVEAPYFFYVPNGFTPDHNGINESFCPSGKGIDITSYSMEIYDRWGALIYKTTTALGCWDGLLGGERAPVGNYIYKISLKDMESKHHDYMGQFNLIR